MAIGKHTTCYVPEGNSLFAFGMSAYCDSQQPVFLSQ